MSQPTDILEHLIYLGDLTEPCPYLADRVSTLRFGNGLLAGDRYRTLLDLGYRRNGVYVYRPACRMCQECKILRVPVAGLRMNKDQRRVWRRGQERFEVRLAVPQYTPEKAEMYERYLRFQHGDTKTPVDEERYTRFLVQTCLGGRTFELQLWAGATLAGAGIVDRVGDALSTVYFYFDPAYAEYSPGTYSALYEIDLARRWELTYYYFGYYIAGCASMRYKARFCPCEVKDLDSGHWRKIARGPATGQ
ncbi:MAG: arginyltransferase [Candidatus Hydrogenedentes bacterium]|nr:arginyltransferase [Candidatus Hydrogenedentota bacterium]MBI3117429.1 arginyltransferase [Candidatus Hydrogenedentota bacterium]